MGRRPGSGKPLAAAIIIAGRIEAVGRFQERVVSAEQDRKFFDIFMIVLGSLVAVAVAIYALAQAVQARTQDQYIKEDKAVQAQVSERIAPVGQVAVAGADNSHLAPAPAPAKDAQPVVVAAAETPSGEEVYKMACAACHAAGVAGAPKLGDAAAWSARIEQGMDTLVSHAINGFQGTAGYMPPKGGRTDLSDDAIRASVEYMVENSK
jgi:cytochrome c5